jgi:hypothetical protein
VPRGVSGSLWGSAVLWSQVFRDVTLCLRMAMVPDVSNDRDDFIFGGKQSKKKVLT